MQNEAAKEAIRKQAERNKALARSLEVQSRGRGASGSWAAPDNRSTLQKAVEFINGPIFTSPYAKGEEAKRAYEAANAQATNLPLKVIVNPIKDELVSRFVDALTRITPETFASRSKATAVANSRDTNLETIIRALADNKLDTLKLRKAKSQEDISERTNIVQSIRPYINALARWNYSYSDAFNMRKGAEGLPVEDYVHDAATRLKEMLNAAAKSNPTVNNLFRGSSLKELEGALSNPGEFYNPALSFSTSSKIAKQFGDNLIVLEPGAKSLRGLNLFEANELEHIVGGTFKVVDEIKTPKRTIVKVKQTDPTVK